MIQEGKDSIESGPMQVILPTDKRNPSFSLYLCEKEQSLHVFYGLELLEVVPFDRQHAAYKLLVARLYNAGLRIQTLVDVFGVDAKTMRGWGGALQARNPALLARMLLGADAGRKRTAAITGYVRQRWPQLIREGCRNYRQTLQQEIERIFDTRLSGETLRLLLAEIRAEAAPGVTVPVEPSAEVADEHSGQSPVPTSDAPQVVAGASGEVVIETSIRESTCSEQAAGVAGRSALRAPDSLCEDENLEADLPADPDSASSKSIPCFWSPRPNSADLCDHAGLLLFAGPLGSLSRAVDPPEPLLSQWLASILLGARNLEQTKYLNSRA